ncbi:MAG: squalene/phytoene synthase family protein [Elusimicrobiales bacterium]|nr:squalene/phytoene synthase family protein [Elusimicrobiales bacterium]
MASKRKSLVSEETRKLLKNVSRTLYLSIKIMPESIRSDMSLGYLVCRALDSVVDAPQLPRNEKLEMLRLVRGIDNEDNCRRMAEAGKRLAPETANAGEAELLSKFGTILNIYHETPEARRPLLKMLFSGIAEGMETDIKHFDGTNLAAFAKEEDVDRYCHLIGGVPGIFWASLYRKYFLARNPGEKNLPSAEDGDRIGKALQITNILKDIAADIKNGRCYIPLSDLESAGLKPEDLRKPENFQKLRPIINKWLLWGISNLDCSERFMQTIPKRDCALRAAVIWPVYWSEDTFAAVAKANVLDSSRRPKISRRRIYSTIMATPPLLVSNMAFARGYRFRRETLMLSMESSVTEENL